MSEETNASVDASTALTGREETSIRLKIKKESFEKCKDLMNMLGECSAAAGISSIWKCEEEKKAWRDCVNSYQTEEYYEKARAEYLKTRPSYLGTTGTSNYWQSYREYVKEKKREERKAAKAAAAASQNQQDTI